MVPADFDTANSKERLMNVVTPLITNAKTPILVQPRESSFYCPTIDTQSASIFGPALGQEWNNSSATKLSPMRFRVISSITKKAIGMLNRSANLACDWRNTVNQRQKLCDVVAVRAGQYHRKRDTIGVRYQMVFRPFLAAIRWVWAFLAPQKWLEPTTSRLSHDKNLSGLLVVICSAAPCVSGPTRLLFAILAADASRSFRNHSPSLAAGLPSQYLFSTRTISPSMLGDLILVFALDAEICVFSPGLTAL